MTHLWKHKYFESHSKELHANIFRSLEIEQYFQKTLKDYGFSLQNYKINFSNSAINILLSVCKLEQTNLEIRKKEILKKTQKHFKNIFFNNLSIKQKSLQILNVCRAYRIQNKKNLLKTISLNSLSQKMLKSLKLFTKNKLNISLTIKEINFVNSNKYAKQTLTNLYKFQKGSFFKKGKRILIPIVTQKSAELLGNFIATQIKTIKKQHNFFFNFLKESLKLLISQKFSKIQGIKIVVKGRIKNAARSRTHVTKLGKISLISTNSKVNYTKSTVFKPSKGTIGVKTWILKKYKCFCNQKKRNIKKQKKEKYKSLSLKQTNFNLVI